MKIGTTLAILHIFGNTPVVNDLFIRVDKGMEIVSWISFTIFVGMLFGPKVRYVLRCCGPDIKCICVQSL